MSCWFGVSPTPLTGALFSVSENCLPSALPRRACSIVSPCSSPRFCATRCPRALYHGPLPIRSRALTAPDPCVLRYACHVAEPRPAAAASDWQCASAPASPPRFAPSPFPTLVTKKDIGCGGACCAGCGGCATATTAGNAAIAATTTRRVQVIWNPPLPPRTINGAASAILSLPEPVVSALLRPPR